MLQRRSNGGGARSLGSECSDVWSLRISCVVDAESIGASGGKKPAWRGCTGGRTRQLDTIWTVGILRTNRGIRYALHHSATSGHVFHGYILRGGELRRVEGRKQDFLDAIGISDGGTVGRSTSGGLSARVAGTRIFFLGGGGCLPSLGWRCGRPTDIDFHCGCCRRKTCGSRRRCRSRSRCRWLRRPGFEIGAE
jgi:hypothetical protein